MVAKRTAPKPAPKEEPPVVVTDHSGWSHDWRNPEAVFSADDHCPNAELRRLAPR